MEREKLVRRKGGDAVQSAATAALKRPLQPTATAVSTLRVAPRASAYIPSSLRASNLFNHSVFSNPTSATPRHLGLAFDHLADPNRPPPPTNPPDVSNNPALAYLFTTSTSQNNTLPSEISRALIRVERSKTDTSVLSSVGHPSPGDNSCSLGNACLLSLVPPLPPVGQWYTPSPIPSARDSVQASQFVDRANVRAGQRTDGDALLEAVPPDGSGLLARWMTPREKLPEGFAALPKEKAAQDNGRWKKLRTLRRKCINGVRQMRSRVKALSWEPVAEWAPLR